MSELPDDVSDYLDLARVGSNNKKCPSLEVFLSVFSSLQTSGMLLSNCPFLHGYRLSVLASHGNGN